MINYSGHIFELRSSRSNCDSYSGM